MLSDRFIEPKESLQPYRSQHPRGRTALIGALLIAVLLAELNSAALANEVRLVLKARQLLAPAKQFSLCRRGQAKSFCFLPRIHRDERS